MARKKKDNTRNLIQESFQFEIEEKEVTKTRQKKKATKREKELLETINQYRAENKRHLRIIYFLLFLCLVLVLCFLLKMNVYINSMDENILFLGDSITQRYDLKKYYKKYHIVNSGISGNTTKDILDNMEERVYQYNPSKIFLLIGTNDLEQGKTNEEIVNNIKKIITLIRKNRPHAEIYLESIYPVNNTEDEIIKPTMVGSRTNERIEDINKELEEYCQEEKITFIDLYPLLLDEERRLDLNYTVEGLHINDKGYQLITKILIEYL